MKVEDFIKELNTLRLSNSKPRKEWYGGYFTVDNKEVKVKAFGTYLQVFEVDGIRCGGLCDITVTKFKQELAAPFNEVQA
jgi:hypothetical protein